MSVLAAAVSACVLGCAGAAAATPAVPATPVAAGHHAKKTAPLTGAAKVQADSAAALRRAEQTGQSVPVASLTTPTSTTVADPAGTFTLTQSPEPVRTWKDGAWKDLDATLHVNADHTVSPNVTATGLVLSGGGSGPLATMTALGHTLSLSWPSALPAPSLSGATATYPSVMPGVDLVVTASPQGGFSDTLVVKTASAAADPGLAKLTMAVASDGLSVTADAAGNLKAAADAAGEPVFSADAPIMWDSATTPGAAQVNAAATAPSDATEPGPDAHTAPIAVSTAASKSISLTPDQGLLTGSSTVFPVYIDPVWSTQSAGSSRQAWAQTDTINKNAAHWEPSTLQNGYCGWDTCSPTFTAESYVRMSVPEQLQGATIYKSELDLTVYYGPYSSCSSAPNPGLELWWTGGISSSTTWNNAPAWHEKINTQYPAACSGQDVGFPITSFMTAHAQGATSLTFGIAAASESDKDAWKQFHASTLRMSTTYDRAPALPSHLATSPGGPCQTGAQSPALIGNDDVTFETVVSDPDGGSLGTEFVIKDSDSTGTVRLDTGDAKNASPALTANSGSVVRLTIPGTEIEGWHPTDGKNKAYTYSWYVRTSDGELYNLPNGTGSSGSPCTFTYDPTQPSAPGATVATDANEVAGALGGTTTLTLAPCAGALASPPTACTGTAPGRYTYQVNSGAPVSIPATGGVQTVQIPLTHIGVNTLTAFALTPAGNAGPLGGTGDFTVTPPTTPYTDGDINGDGHPDLLTAGTGSNPGLWLATGDGAGHLATPIDIGATGSGINTAGTPADWNGAQILHGDFTGDHVQDVLAYYPSGAQAGGASVLDGNGDASPMTPESGNNSALPTGQFADLNGDNPMDLVAAGNASLTNTGIADLIGITGDATHGYQLALYYTTCSQCTADDYAYAQTLAGPADSPDGASDWNNFSLVTAQPGGQTVLFALKKTTGELWEATNPTQDQTKPVGTATSAGGTWTQITVPWGSTPPSLVSGDTNAGNIELWGQTGGTVTDYTMPPAGTKLTAGAGVDLPVPDHEWPLTTSTGQTSSCTATVCTPDTRGGADASVTGGVTIITDAIRGTLAHLDGTGYITPPQNMIASSSTLTLSISFRAANNSSGILFSTGSDTPDKAKPAATPVMYIGIDGRLYAQFWTGTVRPIISPRPVNDGQWHIATLTANGNIQSLYLDDDLRIGMAGSPTISETNPDNFVGAGVFAAAKSWPNAPGTTTIDRASYFTGDIADIAYTKKNLTPDQLSADNQPASIVGPITSQMNSSLCVDDNQDSSADNNKIDIWSCNNSAAQQWKFVPENSDLTNTIQINGKCLDIKGAAKTNNTVIDLYSCVNGAPNQKWQISNDGSLYNPYSGRCLDDPGRSTTNGTQLDIYDCLGALNEAWTTP